MKKTHSANDLLKNFTQNVDFKLYIFDDPPSLGPQVKLREKSKNCEIDAVALYENVFCLIGINKGRGTTVDKEINKFFEKLDKVENVSNVKLKLEITSKNKDKIKDKKEIAEGYLKEIEEHKDKFSKDYNLILRKIFFCPKRLVDDELIENERKQGKIIINKDMHDYFEEVLNRLNKKCLFNDFIHFLNIKKINLAKKGASKTDKPGQSNPFKVNKIELEKDRIIMYSSTPRVEDIAKYITVLRMARKYDKKGFQRMVKATRLNKINEYLDTNETFPNNIIIALDPDIYKDEEDFYEDKNGGEIQFYDEYNSLIIIDGQHRFFSFVKGDRLNRFILVTFIFFKNGDRDDLLMEKLFYKINKTQERIDPYLSFFLEAKIEPNSESNFWFNVFKEKLDKKGFFSGKFSFKETTMKKGEKKKSIISVINYGGVKRLNKEFKKKGIIVDGLNVFYTENKEDNINFAFNLLRNYFDVIEEIMYNQDVDKKTLSPREIGALIRLIKHFMATNKNKLKILGETKNIVKSTNQNNKKTVQYFKSILENIPFKKTIDLDYPASNWAAIEGFILKEINKKKPNFGNKELLSEKGLELYEES